MSGLDGYGTTVVRLRRKDGIIIQDCDIYIGRKWDLGGWDLKQSEYHNPFPLKKYGVSNLSFLFSTLLLLLLLTLE